MFLILINVTACGSSLFSFTALHFINTSHVFTHKSIDEYLFSSCFLDIMSKPVINIQLFDYCIRFLVDINFVVWGDKYLKEWD